MFLRQAALFGLISAFVFAVMGCKPRKEPSTEGEGCRVHMFKMGRKLEAVGDTRPLVSLVESLFVNPDDYYELVVYEEMIEQVKRESDALEIVYTHVRTFEVSSGYLRRFRKLLIPLSGKFARDNNVVMFYGEQTYSSGPHVKLHALDHVDSLVSQLEWK